MQYIAIALVIIFGVYSLLLFVVNRKARRRRRALLRSREVLSVEEWYARYCKSFEWPADLSLTICSLLAEELQCDPTQVYPEDSFDGILKFEGLHFLGIDSDDEVELFFNDIARMFEQANADVDFATVAASRKEPFMTVGDVIAFCQEYL